MRSARPQVWRAALFILYTHAVFAVKVETRMRPFHLGLAIVAVSLALAACGGSGTILPSGNGIVVPRSPQGIVRGPCIPTIYNPCATPTPFNGPVGSANNLGPSSSNPALLTSATSHVIYVNYSAAMGNQVQFLQNLEGSSFFTYILNQYVPNHGTYGVDAAAHYVTAVAQNGYEVVDIMPGNPAGGTELLPITYYDQSQILNAASTMINAGATSDIWHVIVPGDNPLCLQSPNGLKCWGAGSGMANQCGEHSPISVAGGKANFTLQQAFPICSSDSVADGISSTLSHELFETITDPDLTSGWRSGGGTGPEIGDLCQDVDHWIALPYWDALLSVGTFYDIQPEWSNKDAHCYPEVDQKALI